MNRCVVCGKEMRSSSSNRKYCYDCRQNVALKLWVKNATQKRKLRKTS